ncbi:sulfoacetaldehyde acetyltransferase [Variovorax sp. PBL-E5]|uniref:sulfoacetaldehyde acetyltransferase n=1 Tax=Variovorax sp. PBL-E5 TaxID=434014 RepID=UPI001319AFD6|nr:sulfoacetaldehyde acetyltransferase [Variovorax sp. PBL-E5]VTU34456.1 Sulfoacetaldehyde acetyltransferase [Variovorax sp. PBL-E5]
MPRMTPSEAFVETLVAEGVQHVTGLVGSAFQDALDLFPHAGIRFVPVHHELTAAHMADGYARATGRTAVCIGQNGPGCTNMLTAIAVAYQAHSPVVVVTPSAMNSLSGLDGLQEIDQMDIFRAVTKFQARVPSPSRMAETMRAAFRHATARLGPAQVDIPRDFFYGDTDQVILKPEQYRSSATIRADEASIGRAADLLAKAKKPMILAGYGCVVSEAYDATAALAEFLDCPVANTYWHNDSFPTDHPLAVGALGFNGSKVAMQMLAEADVVLMLGSRINDFGYAPQYGMRYYPHQAKIIQVDIDSAQIGRSKPVDVSVVGDARLTATAILEHLQRQGEGSRRGDTRSTVGALKVQWRAELDVMCRPASEYINPYAATRAICEALPENAFVTTDIGFSPCIPNAFLRFTKPRRYIAPGNFANVGFGFPAALGVKLAHPEDPVVAFVGDGGWGFALQEVMTALEENLPVVVILMNNGVLGAEKANQATFLESRFVGVDVGAGFNYAEIARAMGADAQRITDIEQLVPAFKKAVESSQICVLEVMTDPEILNKPFRGEALSKAVRHLDKYKHLASPA